MSGGPFQFKHFNVYDDKCAMKVGTDGVLLGAWTDTKHAKRILDVGTGSGLIAFMLAQKSDAIIDAIDINNDAVIQAKENLARTSWANRIHIYKKALQNFNQEGHQYDLIVSNPPFYSDSSAPKSHARTLARHSDRSLSHEDLLLNVSQLLNADGRFCLILPVKESIDLLKLAPTYNLHCSRKTSVKTKQNKEVKRFLMEFKKELTKTITEELILRNEDDKYSQEYVELTKDYYQQLEPY